MRTGYHNAKKVLPPVLLAEIQRHFNGHLWVPAAKAQAEITRQRVLQLHQAGVGTRDITELVQLSQRRIQQIILDARKANDADVR
ncbi:MAG: hypothetical protein WCJ56_02290 [bacterium]